MKEIIVEQKKSFAKEFKELRKKYKFTQYRITKNSNLQPIQIKSVEAADKSYTVDTLIAMAHTFGKKIVLVDDTD